ncbi:hypothetical protein JZ751_012550 [Albula glossodonta]|uniref:Mineralocorticoid receptor n=1 Tax=Albula glossodonta TaxID=121402 RepID=A0A8T2NXL4_9TELE|nr:hypothetical protein JZ751_012550 [Albula glossodonta]
METKRYQSFFEGKDTESRWPRGSNSECGGAVGDARQADCDMSVDGANVSCGPPTAASFEGNGRDKMDRLPLCPNQKHDRQFIVPGVNSSTRLEIDSKELSKTVAESMGLYMDAVREADYGYGQQRIPEGHCVPEKLFAGGVGKCLELSPPASVGSPKLSPPALPCPAMPRPMKAPAEGSSGGPQGPGLAPSICCSPLNSHSSLSSPTSLVSSTTSPSCFGNARSSVSSPIPPGLAMPPGLPRAHPRLPATCSPPNNASSVASPLASPLNVLRSPISSPRSMGSVRSPPSCCANLRSSVSSPAGGGNGGYHNTQVAPPSRCSPAAANLATAASSPQNSSGFPVSSPDSALGLVQSEGLSPGERGIRLGSRGDFKGFEFPKVETEVDGEMYSVGLDQMGMVKYIKNEHDPDTRSMCLGPDPRRVPCSAFPVQIKSEPNKDTGCLNLPYNQQQQQQQHSLNLLPATETTYLSLRDNIDEYSLSGILGPPVSSLNGNYEPGVFSNGTLPKAIKQELNDGCYYQDNIGVPTSAIVGVNSGSHSFHYQIGAQGTMSFSRHDMKDQANPLLNLISPVTPMAEVWKPRPGLSQSSLSSRGGVYGGPVTIGVRTGFVYPTLPAHAPLPPTPFSCHSTSF